MVLREHDRFVRLMLGAPGFDPLERSQQITGISAGVAPQEAFQQGERFEIRCFGDLFPDLSKRLLAGTPMPRLAPGARCAGRRPAGGYVWRYWSSVVQPLGFGRLAMKTWTWCLVTAISALVGRMERRSTLVAVADIVAADCPGKLSSDNCHRLAVGKALSIRVGRLMPLLAGVRDVFHDS